MTTDRRTEEEIEQTAMTLCAIAFDLDGPMQTVWGRLSDKQKEGWRRVARSVRGVIHHEDATSGSWPTAPQGDRIRELRASYPRSVWEERSWIGSETRPYGEMVVCFEGRSAAAGCSPPSRTYLIHPDGHCEELHKEKIADNNVKVEQKP